MKFLADEGVDKPIVMALRIAGFDVDYILEIAPGSDDEFVLNHAFIQKQILITQDKDFGELVFRLRQPHHGIILIRLDGYRPKLKGELVSKLILKYTSELSNNFSVIQPNVIRIRK
jgi:predicted nuclease of predicted toxin-antitoxin system